MKELLDGVKKVHFIGIGGSGMFPIVQILKQKGFEISGSDNNESDIVRLARSMGILVYMEQKAKNIKGADLIIYTAAILDDNEELKAAKNSNIKVIERNDFLRYFTQQYDKAMCVCGTHGKTTTTAMLTQILMQGKKDPSAIIGGKLDAIGGYARIGKSPFLVCEACEFEDHFLKLCPNTVIVLNIDNDHLEYFKNMTNLKNSFQKFCEKATDVVIYNGDDENTKDVVKKLEKKSISFGFKKDNDYYADNITKINGFITSFDVYKKGKLLISNLKIKIPGIHNVLNALACVVAAFENDVLKEDVIIALERFKGVKRRFELIGDVKGISVFDDYAHHPREIYVTLKALKDCGFKKIWVVHQPFTFSRTMMLKKEFKDALILADKVIITDILGSREKNENNLTGEDLSRSINGAVYIKNQSDVKDYILNNAKKGDVVITMGCGDIYKAAKMIVFGKY